MKVKFEVVGSGSFEGQTKSGQKFQRLRMMGFALDCDGAKVPATCDMGYNATIDSSPASGDTVIVDITSFDTRNAMASMTFASLSHVAASQSRELKRQ